MRLPLPPLSLPTALLLAAATLTAGMASAGPAAAAPAPVNVTVNAAEGLGTIPSTAYGLNSAVWDSQMNAPQVQNLLQQAGVQMLRYPGGSYGDIYNWQDNTAPGGYVAPGTDFDSFMGTVQKIGAQPILIANYGTGTPQEAAGWVQYANITKGYGVKYWEIGNEIYGNGYYGSDWEADDHASKSPATYAQNLVQYASAMKAVDPSIKIGAVLTLPGNWPDSVVAAGDSADWNKTVLSDAGGAIDFVIVHWYPSPTSAASMLAEPEPGGRGTGPAAPGDRPVRRAGRAGHPDRDDRGELRGGHRHPAGRAVRRGHLPDRAGQWRVHRGLVGHPQRAHRDQHRTGRGYRLRRLGHPVQRHLRGQHLRAAAEHPVPQLLRAGHAEQDRPGPATPW